MNWLVGLEMGITTGASVLIDHLIPGLFANTLQSNNFEYKINVDGSLLNFKGLCAIKFAESQSQLEMHIAKLSTNYVNRRIKDIQSMIGKPPKQIIIYMDGRRPRNKKQNKSNFKHNVRLAHKYFIQFCEKESYTVVQLEEGESELWMYLNRDKLMNLNVFVTDDSDFISIAYQHQPNVIAKYTTMMQPPKASKANDILNHNYTYTENIKVFDSCLWVKCGKKKIQAIGLDFASLGFNLNVFRIFVALCGTDYTDNLFPMTSIKGIVTAPTNEKEKINNLSDIHEIISILLILSVKYGGSLKNRDKYQKLCFYSINDLPKTMNMYNHYITTGEMVDDDIPRPSMANVCHEYWQIMQKNENITKPRRIWAATINLDMMLQKISRHFTAINKNINTN